jgi:hypothetical protein
LKNFTVPFAINLSSISSLPTAPWLPFLRSLDDAVR